MEQNPCTEFARACTLVIRMYRRASSGGRSHAVFAGGEKMAEETTGDEEDDAGYSTKRGMQEPEMCRGHFFEKAADPADEIVRGKEGQVINADDGGGQRGRRNAGVKGERDGEDVRKTNAVEQMKGDEPAD